MAITDGRDAQDAIWYATDAISNRLHNDSLFIEKPKDYCYNINLDNSRGLGEQKVWIKGKYMEYMDEICELKPATKIPTREDIYKKIEMFANYDPPRDECIITYRYKGDDGYVAKSECRIDRYLMDNYTPIKYKEAERTKCVAINMLTDKVLKHYNNKRCKEEYSMIGSEFMKIENGIRMIRGNLTIEGITSGDCTAHIEIPFEYLKYIKVAMPTTDFCVSKRNDTGNWVEGLPAIKKIETYNDRVTKVTFIDDTFTKSVCSENDHFDLDVGITICCMKRMMGKDGNKHYNDIIRHAHKVIVENDKKREKEAKEKAERKMKRRKEELKKAAERLKAKEEQIDTQAQAIVRAHYMLEDERKNG